MAPLKLAIVGSGPSAFYVASRLLSLLPKSAPHASSLKIDMYDRLWAPYGLVRYGVAPDHPEVKNCTHKFDTTATDPRLRFHGNINVETPNPLSHALQLPLRTLVPYYTHILFSTGCTVPIHHPELPPSHYCLPALSLVHWYTQHPSRPSPPPLESTSHVTLIGHGNVSLDVARMLLTPPELLAKYDVPAPVLDVLRRSTVQHVSIVGRRGPLQAAFTTKELREMMNLPDSSMVPLDPTLLAEAESRGTLTRQQSRTLQLLQKGSKNQPGTTRKTWSLDFFRSPVKLVTPTKDNQHVRPQLSLARTTLGPSSQAIVTHDRSTIPTDLVVTSLGYCAERELPQFDSNLGHLRTVGGRVVDNLGRVVRNMYASGWAATGSRGALASTMMDAYAVADTILRDHFPDQDVQNTLGEEPESVGQAGVVEVLPKEVDLDTVPPLVEDGLKHGVVTNFETWRAVDAEEIRRGEAMGKERERMGWEEACKFLTRSKT